jgi:hypothetical protein
VDTPFAPRAPETLVVLGFQRGRYPATAGTPLLLGPLERAALARAADLVPGLAEVADEGTRAALLERDARRALTLPTRTLVLVSPRRDASGEQVDPSLARRDLLAAYPPEVAEARVRRGPRSMAQWSGAASTPRAALWDLVTDVGAGEAHTARTRFEALAGSTPGVADFVASRWRPDASFVLGALVRDALSRESYSLRSLEMLLKCRYGFLLGAVLRLRELRLARAPSLSLGDHAVIAHTALRTLDGEAPPSIAAAVEAAVGSRARADRPELTMEAEEIRRTVTGFVERYADVREAWGLTGGTVLVPPPREGDTRPTTKIALETHTPGAPREIAVVGEAARVETVSTPEGPRAVVVELRTGGVDRLSKQREAGMGVAAALLPVIAEQQHGVPVAALAHLSLGKAEAEVLASGAVASHFGPQAGRTAVALDRVRPLEQVRNEMLARLASEMDAIAADGGTLAPHSPEQRARLTSAGVKSCEYCVGALACRYGLEAR